MKDKREIVKDKSPWGGIFQKREPNPLTCNSWEKSFCLEQRLDTDPESMLTADPNVLMCPLCHFKIPLEPVEEEASE